MHRLSMLLALLLLLIGCAGQPGPKSYHNPVIDADFPDPAIIRGSDGFYHAYATQGGTPQSNIQAARSTDLVTWYLMGDALPTKPVWASRTQDFWAPTPIAADGRYFLYFSAKPDAALEDPSMGLCLGVATSTSLEGPFVDSGRSLQCGPGFVNIDPFAFDDPITAKPYLFWGSGFEPIKVRELAANRLAFAPGSAPISLVKPDKRNDPANYRRLIEGAWVHWRAPYYYLFFSGDNCCGDKAHYAVMVARSKQITGPFDTRPAPFNLVVHANGRWNAPGHNSLIQDAKGHDWLVYHAVDVRRPRTRPSDDVNSRRSMLIDRIVWINGWPEVAGHAPSSDDRSAPASLPAR